MSWKRRILRLISITLLTPVVFLFSCQSRLIYYPTDYVTTELDFARRSGVRAIPYTSNGQSQTAWLLPAQKTPQRLWVCFSGNAARALDWLPTVEDWNEEAAFLMVDLPGYGSNSGSPNPRSIRQAAMDAVDACRAQDGLARVPLGCLGHSLGAACALMTATERKADRVVLISPFTSMAEMADQTYFKPVSLLLRHRFDNRTELRRLLQQDLAAQVTLIHGEQDSIIPVSMSRDLQTLDPTRIQLHVIPEADHNDAIDLATAQIEAALAP